MVALIDGIESVEVEDGEFIIVDTNSGRYMTANSTATEMLAAMSAGLSDDETIALLKTRLLYLPRDDRVLIGDLLSFQNSLVEVGIARVVNN